jgi:hypothetical protein
MITTLVASIRQFRRIIHPQGSLFRTFGASLGISDNSKANAANKRNSQKPQPYCNCFCGKKHWCNECCYINLAIQPPEWKLKANIAAMFEQAKKNPRIAEQFRKAAEGGRTETTSQTTTATPIAFDTQLCKGLILRVVARMISDEFDSFPANPESPLFVAGNPDRLRRVGRPSGWTSP